MTDIERRLRAAMHAAVDGEEASADLVNLVVRRHWRHVARVAGIAALAVAVLAAVPAAFASRGTGSGPGDGPGSAHSATISSHPAVHLSASPKPPVHHSGSPKPTRREPSRMHGLALPPGKDLRLLLTGPQPAWFFTATGGVQPIAGLPRSRFAYTVSRVLGGWATQPSPQTPACATDCPGPRLPEYFIANNSAVARRVGVAQGIAAGTGRSLLWLETYPPGTADVTAASAFAQSVSASGQRIGRPVRLPTGYGIRRAVGSYLLLTPVVEGPGPVIDKLWDPVSRRVVRTFDNVLAVSQDQIAWGICGNCAVRVLDLSTSRTLAIPVPPGTWAYDGIFSSDGRFLAVHLSAGVEAGGRATLARIGVIDISRSRLATVRGSSIGMDLPEHLDFGWQGTSHRLIAAVSGSGSIIQVAGWHPGAPHLLVGLARVPHGTGVVVGEYG